MQVPVTQVVGQVLASGVGIQLARRGGGRRRRVGPAQRFVTRCPAEEIRSSPTVIAAPPC
jgi:hypothetical protein